VCPSVVGTWKSWITAQLENSSLQTTRSEISKLTAAAASAAATAAVPPGCGKRSTLYSAHYRLLFILCLCDINSLHVARSRTLPLNSGRRWKNVIRGWTDDTSTWRIQKFRQRGWGLGRKTKCKRRRRLSQMHTTNHTPLHTGKAARCKTM